MAQRYALRLETITGNVYGDGDVLLGNMDDLLRPAGEGKPWTKTEDYLESAIPSAYEPVERSKYYGIARVETGSSDPNTLPVKPGEFDVADAHHPSAEEFSRPALPSTILSQPFPNDILHGVGDCLYITSAFSFHTNLVIEPTKYGTANRVFYGNLDITEALHPHAIAVSHHPVYCPFNLTLFSGTGGASVFLRSDILGRQGIVHYSLSLTEEKLIFYADSATGVQAREPINLQEGNSDRVKIFGQVKMEVVNKDEGGRITLNCNTSYYTSGGILLASFDWSLHNPQRDVLELGIAPHDGGGPYASSNIPNIIIPGIRIHHFSITTEPIDLGDTFGQKTYTPYLNGNGLATAWSITKNWVNKYKQDKLTAGNNITIENNVISASGGGESVDLTDYAKKSEIPDVSNLVKKSEIPDVSGLQPKLTAGNNITIENNVISATGSGGEGGSVDLSNYYNKTEIDSKLLDIPGSTIESMTSDEIDEVFSE